MNQVSRLQSIVSYCTSKHAFLPGLLILALGLLRLPFLIYAPGVQDENWFAVPGWTVAREGIPRIPYVPVEDPQSVFHRAHEVLFTLPPLLFYLQAPCFALLPDNYTTARLPSWLGGMIALAIVYALARQLGVRRGICYGALIVCALSRPFFFAWMNARPDMLCAVSGLVAMLFTIKMLDRPTTKSAVMAGVFVGIGALAHPFAIVFACQLAVVFLFLLQSVNWQARMAWLAVAGFCSVAAFSLWGLLIAVDPELFRVQFSNNVLSRSGPGLLSRLVWPWPALPYQVELFRQRNGWPQTLLCILTLFAGSVLYFRKRSPNITRAIVLTCTALYFHLASVGSHSLIDYWCYTWCWIVILGAVVMETIAANLVSKRTQQLAIGFVGTALLVTLLPGAGLRAAVTYIHNHGDWRYDRTEFCRRVNARLPEGARLLVAADYVFEFEVLGRRPVNASRARFYQDVEGLDFDYWVASRSDTRARLPQTLGCKKLFHEGVWDDDLACYVDIYGPPEVPHAGQGWPR